MKRIITNLLVDFRIFTFFILVWSRNLIYSRFQGLICFLDDRVPDEHRFLAWKWGELDECRLQWSCLRIDLDDTAFTWVTQSPP